MVRYNSYAILGHNDRHLGVAADNFMQQTFSLRAEMRDDDERHAGLAGNAFEQAFHRGNATRGRADANDGKSSRSGSHGMSPFRRPDMKSPQGRIEQDTTI